MRSLRGATPALFVAMLLVGVAAVAGWAAVGRLADATELALARTEASLDSAKVLADSTAASAAEVEAVLDVVGKGLGSTGEALAATEQVSANLRKLLDVVGFIGRVDNLSNSLEQAESSLAAVQIDLSEASSSVADAAPNLHATVVALQEIPGELAASRQAATLSRAHIGAQVKLWRLGIVAGALAILAGLWTLATVVHSLRTETV